MPDTAAPVTTSLLWEVGFEELPAWACEQLLKQVSSIITEELRSARLDASETIQLWAGPRRFSVITEVETMQRPELRQTRGPAVVAAFKDGVPTRACEGFARSNGMTPADLEIREEHGKEFVYAVREATSDPFATVFPGVAEKVMGRLNFAKPMRWGDGTFRFVRPIRWIVTLAGETTVPYGLWGVTSGCLSRTHRFLGDDRNVRIEDADGYVKTMAARHVVVEQVERRRIIEDGLDEAAKQLGGEWFDPAGVLREVVHLVEYPTVITGRFDERYLTLPERVLVTAMQSHQRYLPVRDGHAGLAPAFLAVMNGDPDAIGTIIPGYERVLVGRLDDAVFSFRRDRDRGIDEMAGALDKVVFHAKAGSLAQRTERIRRVARELVRQLGDALDVVDTAARLCKADQVSVLVQEFAELEGYAGSLYAHDAGYDDAVCAAIDQQFMPRSAEAVLPEPGVPAIIALADKLELLVTAFSIGEQPTGSRDPHGLRRAAIGIMRIILEHDLPIDAGEVLKAAAGILLEQGIGEPTDDVLESVWSFILDRVDKLLVEDGVRFDVVRAARAAGLPLLQHLVGLSRALDAASGRGDENFDHVLTAVTRCSRILAKAADEAIDDVVDVSQLTTEAERSLAESVTQVADPLRAAVESADFDEAVVHAATLGPAVDLFFDRDRGVMVMDGDLAIRARRLALVRSVVDALAPLGDLTRLQV